LIEEDSWVTPGDKIGLSEDLVAGTGTYARGKYVYASLLGRVYFQVNGEEKGDTCSTVTVVTYKRTARSKVLRVGQIILGRVTSISTLQVGCIDILAAEGAGVISRDGRQGVIRKDDLCPGPSEAYEVADCMRPGDLILAQIRSLGDAHRYLLTTVDPALGVVRAKCASSGCFMAAYTPTEMQCPETLVKEKRKCAEPGEETAIYKLLEYVPI